MGKVIVDPRGAAAAEEHVVADEPGGPLLIEARGLTRAFGKKRVVDGLDLVLPEGSVTALLGRNGVGKSTTIQLLLGLLPPARGTVRVLGMDPARERRKLFAEVAYVSEKRELLEEQRVEGLARIVAAAHGARFDRDGFERLRARYKLDPSTPCAVLSKGQRARLLLALALAARPRLLVLDEPTSGLDPLVRDDFLEAIATFAAGEDRVSGPTGETAGRGVLLSTHIVEDVARICDRAVVLREGCPALAGELETLRESCGHYLVRLSGVLPPEAELTLPRGAVVVERDARALSLVAQGAGERVEAELDQLFPVAGIERRPATLREAFACLTEPVPPAEGGRA